MAEKLSPMMEQYFRKKEENPGTILFFRLGDFYEMFYDDAKLVSKELELTLTGKACGQDEKAPMCGIPFHSCDSYIARLVAKGYKVAICEQTEDPATANGKVVDRDVIRIITPGTVIESEMLDESTNNYLAGVFKDKAGVTVGFVDSSTGSLLLTSFENDADFHVKNELSRFEPKEIVVNRQGYSNELVAFAREQLAIPVEISDLESEEDLEKSEKEVLNHFNAENYSEMGLETRRELNCVGIILRYLKQTQMSGLQNISEVRVYHDSEYMAMDRSARANLELFRTMRNGEKRGSLLWVLEHTKTAMGKRMLRSWLEHPLVKPAAIIRRLHAVEEIYNNLPLCDGIIDAVSGIYDLERVITRIVYGNANPQEYLSLASAQSRLPLLKETIAEVKSPMLRKIYDDIDILEDTTKLIFSAINPQAPTVTRDGGFIARGYNAELDEVRDLMNGGHSTILAIEEREKQRTGIKNLKVKYNKVFGYFIEVTNSFKHLVPEDYIRKQTTLNSERYITEELKELEQKVLTARDKSIAMELRIFSALREEVSKTLSRVQKTASAVAQLDVLACFADISMKNKYVCPEISADGITEIKGGRHPVVEQVSKTPFVPNDVLLDTKDNRCAVITGPNMAGKSTFMRQVALITIMAQMGCFVPADYAKIGVVDAVFTRVGASDDLFAGQSTFMVEMSEVSFILKNATKNSLIILDEIGRGTATYDGMSIAQAVLEHIVSGKIGARTLFATHYHELTVLEDRLEGVKNYNIAVKKRGDDITFLRRIMRGPADRSYGIEVAALAGVPKPVVERAKAVLKGLESGEIKSEPVFSKKQTDEESPQMALYGLSVSPVVEKLKQIDVDTLTPIEALTKLYEMVNEAKKE